MNTPNFIKFSILAIGVFGFACVSSCTKDSAEARYKPISNVPCDTANITFAAVISPKLNAECASCHAWASANDPSSYTQVRSLASDIFSRVSANQGDPIFMPQGGQSWSSCELQQFKQWMDQGFKQ